MELLTLAYCGISEFPNILRALGNLEYIDLSNNIINGKIPEWLWSLPRLGTMDTRNNSFNGFQGSPQVLINSSLRMLYLDSNNFEGTLPDLPLSIRSFSAELNSFEGEIPLSICNRSSLVALVLAYNNLSGPIPESIGLLKALIALNLSNNAFTGHIPLSMATLENLESLDMSRNQLSGTIPNGLGSLSFLAYINVSDNQLKGEIPQGPQITGQSKSSFEGNAGLCGLPLEESCFGSNTPPTQQPKETDDEEEEEVLSWKAVAIGCEPGVLFGLAIAATSHCFIQARVARQDNWSE